MSYTTSTTADAPYTITTTNSSGFTRYTQVPEPPRRNGYKGYWVGSPFVSDTALLSQRVYGGMYMAEQDLVQLFASTPQHGYTPDWDIWDHAVRVVLWRSPLSDGHDRLRDAFGIIPPSGHTYKVGNFVHDVAVFLEKRHQNLDHAVAELNLLLG